MFGLGPTELIIILVIALLVFGPGRLPEIGGALGKGIRDFRKASEGRENDAEPQVTARQDDEKPVG